MGGPQQDPVQAAMSDQAAVPNIPNSPKERVFGMLGALTGGLKDSTTGKGNALDDAIQKHHQQRLDEARMHRRTASTALAIWSYGTDPKTGQKLTPEQEQQYLNEWNASMDAYNKVAGVNKQTKQAIQQSRMLAEQTAKAAREKRQNQGPGQFPMNVGDAGVTPNPDFQQPPQTPDASAGPAAPAGGGPPPVPFEAEAPFLQEQMQYRLGTQRAIEQDNIAFKQRKDQLEQSGMDPKSLAAQEYLLTGKITSSATRVGKFTQGPYMEDPNGVPRKVLLSPDGQYVDPITHEPITDEWKTISASDLATKTVQLFNPVTQQPELVFRKGDKLYDNSGKPIEGDLIPYSSRMLDRTTDKEVAVFDPETHQFKKMLFRNTAKVSVPGIGSTPAVGGGQAAPAQGGGPPAVPAGGGATSKPSAGATGGSRGGAKSSGSFIPAGQLNALNKPATAVLEARNSLNVLAGDLDIYKSPESGERIKNYLSLVDSMTANEGKEIAKQGPMAAVEWYLNLPQTVIGLQTGALMDQYQKLSQPEQNFVADYFRTLGTIGGMRAATGASSAQWSYNVLRSEVPVPGIASYADAKRRIGNYYDETDTAATNNPLIPKADRSALNKRGGGPPAPGGAGTVTFTEGRHTWIIPKEMVAEFKKDHPNARQ